jgi:hypothetical protein
MSWVLVVTEERNPQLTASPAVSYESPPHRAFEEARSLVVLLSGLCPTGPGPWCKAIAGGRRTVELRCRDEQRSSIPAAQRQSER